MNRSTQSPHSEAAVPSPLQLRVVISNGNPHYDVKLKFEFSQEASGGARVWLVQLPRIRNADAFPQRISACQWELRLEASGDTQPIHINSYTLKSVSQWLADVVRPSVPAPTELLILAQDSSFTIALHQFHLPHEK